MWRGCVVFVVGCSFTPGTFDNPLVDAKPGTGSGVDALLDAPPDAVPTWQVIETLVVDSASSNPVTSMTALDNGVTYRLRVSGTVATVIDDKSGDAEYWDFAAPKDEGCCEDIGLGIDDIVVNDKDTKPDWGPYSATHVYEAGWIGDGTTITALYQDTFHGNNVGNLTLEILEVR